MRLKIGARYQLRNGAIIEVTSLSLPNDNYPVLSFDIHSGEVHCHTLTGKAYITGDETVEDIVAEVRKPTTFWLGKLTLLLKNLFTFVTSSLGR
jgi:hypothetical protein